MAAAVDERHPALDERAAHRASGLGIRRIGADRGAAEDTDSLHETFILTLFLSHESGDLMMWCSDDQSGDLAIW
jgi:hypothetical protein